MFQEPKPQRPHRCTDHELAKVDVEIYIHHLLQLQCKNCGQIWSPNLLPGGRLPKGYWRCPNGCNAGC